MSYERSPRAVCSTTMGIRFRPRSFIERLLFSIGLDLAELRQLGEGRGFLADLCLAENPFDRLLLEYLRLYLPHHLRVLQVGSSHFLWVRIRTGEFVQLFLHGFAAHFD